VPNLLSILFRLGGYKESSQSKDLCDIL
jgi:hypothetical protein